MKCSSADFNDLSQDILAGGRILKFKAQGASMYPFIRDNQNITIKKVPAEDINFGDIVCFYSSSRDVVVHRIIRKQISQRGSVFLSRGDFSPGSKKEEILTQSQILGKVIAVEKGRVTINLDSKFGRFFAKIYTFFLPFSRYVFLALSKSGSLFRLAVKRKNSRSAEHKLLSLFSCINLNARKKGEISQLIRSKHINWDYFTRQSRNSGLSALIYHHLEKNKDMASRIPDDVRLSLKGSYYGNMARNIIIENEAKRIFTDLRKKAVKTIALKGFYLSRYVYQSAALRPMNDIDILIRKKDLQKVNKVLSELGYFVPPQYKDFLTTKATSSINSLTYFYPGEFNFLIHVHWHVINVTWPLENIVEAIDMKDVWAEAIPVQINEIETLSPSYEHTLIFLLIHAFTHNFDRLVLACDIFEFIKKFSSKINMEVFNKYVKKFQISKVISHALLRLKEMYADDFPEIYFDIRINALTAYLYKKSIFPRFLSYLVFLSTQRTVGQKIKFVFKTFFPARYAMAHNLNISAQEVKMVHYLSRTIKSARRMF